MLQPNLQYWFEFGGTYSYLSVFRIEQVAADAGINVEWKPFLLGPLIKEFGWDDSPFNIYPVKGRYMWRDLERLCQQYGLPFQKPEEFPKNGLYAAPIATIAAVEGWCPAFTKAVFRANFSEDHDISAPEVLTGILESIGQNVPSVFERAQTQENKDCLRQQTEKTPSIRIFSAPSFIANGELFWAMIGWSKQSSG